MNTKDAIINELEQTPEEVLAEVLNYLRYLKAMREEELEDLADIQRVREEIQREGTVSWTDVKQELGLS